MRPRDLATLIQAAGVEPDDIALVVGRASGYGAGLLARIASHVALEQDLGLAAFAAEALRKCGIHNISIASGPLNAGWPARAPYDVIVVEGAIEALPSALPNQLTDGGRLVCVEGRGSARAMLYRSDAGVTSGRSVFDAAAPLLPGFSAPAAFVF
jgi:protein-L-isoaspartate(D-aspartate) O-methyltransferase